MKRKQIKFLKKIAETPSPTGYEVPVASLVRKRLFHVADEIQTDTMGSVRAVLKGGLGRIRHFDQDSLLSVSKSDGAGPRVSYCGQCDAAVRYGDPRSRNAGFDGYDRPITLMLDAHMDEIGLMVTYISDEGYLSIAAIGGVDPAILPGIRVDVHARGEVLRGVVGRKPIHLIESEDRKNVTSLDKLVVDIGLPGNVAKEKVRVGDPVTFAAGFEQFGQDMAVSRGLDDKIGVFIACRVMETLADMSDYAGNFVAAITVQEEIGTRGAITTAHSVNPDVAIAFDVTHATDYPGIDKAKYGSIACGGGPVIARGPNINPKVFEMLVAAAEIEGIDYQIEAEPSVTGTDARAIQVTRDGIPTGLVSVPIRYMHTPAEVVNMKDIESAIQLISRFAHDLDGQTSFVPGMDFHAVDTFARRRSKHQIGELEGQSPAETSGIPYGRTGKGADSIEGPDGKMSEAALYEDGDSGFCSDGTAARSSRSDDHRGLFSYAEIVHDADVASNYGGTGSGRNPHEEGSQNSAVAADNTRIADGINNPRSSSDPGDSGEQNASSNPADTGILGGGMHSTPADAHVRQDDDYKLQVGDEQVKEILYSNPLQFYQTESEGTEFGQMPIDNANGQLVENTSELKSDLGDKGGSYPNVPIVRISASESDSE